MMTNSNLSDEQIALRPIQIEDAAALHEIYSEPATMMYYRKPLCRTLDDSRNLIGQMIAGCGAGLGFRWTIISRESGAIIGSIGFHGWDKSRGTAYLSYEIVPRYRGNGWAQAAGRIALGFGRREMNLQRALAIIDESNVASLKAAERLSFLRQAPETAAGSPMLEDGQIILVLDFAARGA